MTTYNEEVFKFRNWLDKEAIIELVVDILEDKNFKISFENMKKVWFDCLFQVGQEIEDWFEYYKKELLK